jgi:hypothetical protein
MLFRAFICSFGFEAVATGANPGPWWTSLVLFVIPAAIGLVWVAWPSR